MVNSGSFSGQRKLYLQSQVTQYTEGVKNETPTTTMDTIVRGYFLRFPVAKPEDWEPTEVEMAAVDDNAVVPEPPAPNTEGMTTAELEEFEREEDAITESTKKKREVSSSSFS